MDQYHGPVTVKAGRSWPHLTKTHSFCIYVSMGLQTLQPLPGAQKLPQLRQAMNLWNDKSLQKGCSLHAPSVNRPLGDDALKALPSSSFLCACPTL